MNSHKESSQNQSINKRSENTSGMESKLDNETQIDKDNKTTEDLSKMSDDYIELTEKSSFTETKNDPAITQNDINLSEKTDTDKSYDEMGDDTTEAMLPMTQAYGVYCPVGLESLLETTQLVIHKENLRLNQEVNKEAAQRLEIVDDTRRVLYLAEQHIPQEVSEGAEGLHAFKYSVYNRASQEVMSVFCPSSSTCLCCNASWHCGRCCKIQAVVFCPPGVITGFVRQAQTWFVQEFEVLDTQENVLMRLRGAINDLELYSPDLESELGRIAIHGWVGIMHELKRSAGDWGITFPMDLDVRAKAILLGAVFVIDWLNEKLHR